jgi:thiamine biosynthesis lipoprotein
MRCDKRAIAALAILSFCIASSGSSSLPETLTYRKKYAMGTVFEIVAYDQSPEHASRVIEKAFQEIVHLDDLFSNYKAESAVSQVNRSAHFHAEKVPPDLYVVIGKALLFSRLTAGKFDVSVAPLVNLWKAALAGDGVPSPAQLDKARDCVGYKKMELIAPDQIRFRSPCLQLDLGAIGKGYAVDKAAGVLKDSGIRDVLVSAGGSTILAMGSPPGETGWLVHLRDPSHKANPMVRLKDQSVSTSEQTAPTLIGKDSAGHIIDPETGMPLRANFAVSVIAKTATESDALSTSLLLMGPEKGKRAIKTLSNVSAIWISADAKVELANRGPHIFLNGTP